MDWIQVIIQGGAVGLAAYTIYVLEKRAQAADKIIGNHIDHNTEVMRELTKVLAGMKTLMESRERRQRKHGDRKRS